MTFSANQMVFSMVSCRARPRDLGWQSNVLHLQARILRAGNKLTSWYQAIFAFEMFSFVALEAGRPLPEVPNGISSYKDAESK